MEESSSSANEDEQLTVRSTRSSLPQALWRKSIAPVKSLKKVNFASAAGQLVLFGVKVAALEAVRRISQARCRPLWWGLQGIFSIQAPPFNWLQRWSSFQHIAQATQVRGDSLIWNDKNGNPKVQKRKRSRCSRAFSNMWSTN